jgi:c-di-GMP-binding flagellar brake protein YcgR
MPVHERRRFERTATAIRVEIFHPTFGTAIGFTMDISDGGAQVSMENNVTPPVGTIVDVVFKRMTARVNADPVPMKVMHCHRNVIGLMFVTR